MRPDSYLNCNSLVGYRISPERWNLYVEDLCGRPSICRCRLHLDHQPALLAPPSALCALVGALPWASQAADIGVGDGSLLGLGHGLVPVRILALGGRSWTSSDEISPLYKAKIGVFRLLAGLRRISYNAPPSAF